MEKSIKRVEKLVHATNSALAQMKFSLMFDDASGSGDGKLRNAKPLDPLAFEEAFLDGDDLKHCQSEFSCEANQVLAKVESTWGKANDLARKNAKAIDRIKEINRKMDYLRLEQSKARETEQSRQKLVNLINEAKFSPGFASSRDSDQSRHTGCFNQGKGLPAGRKTASLVAVTKSPSKPKEELKKKILETQEIVNRGFQTARHLAQKVETMSKHDRKEKTPSTDKTVSEINVKSSEGKTESNETVSTVKCRKPEKGGKRKRGVEHVERANARLIGVKRKELEGKPNLQLQRLPSLHIKGGLQLQKIHSLEIPAGGDSFCSKSNTAINFLSHEQVKNEKMDEIVEKVRKENCCCSGNDPRGNYVECFNCGKLIRIRENCVDPQKVDEILEKCNFDVFDPRIDEFVEKYAAEATTNWCRKSQPPDESRSSVRAAATAEPEMTRREVSRKKKDGKEPTKGFPKLQLLSDQLLKKYKEETETIESSHLKLDNILQNLFRQVDESREVFEKCQLFRNKKFDCGLTPKLTTTRPVLISLDEASFRGARKNEKSEKRVNNLNENRVRSGKMKTHVPKREEHGASRSAEVGNKQERTSLIYASPAGRSKSERREEVPGRLMLSSSSGHSNSEKLSQMEKPEGVRSSVTSPPTCNGLNAKHSQIDSVNEVVEEAHTPSVQNKRREPSERCGHGSEDTQRKSRGLSDNVTTTEQLETGKEQVVEEAALSVTLSSSSSSKSRKRHQDNEKIEKSQTDVSVQELSAKSLFGKTETERKMVAASHSSKSENEEKVSSETSSERSENNYESDFESVTNEPNECLNEYEEEEPAVNPDINKLSTISEVDSELERKVSDEQKTGRSGLTAETDDTSAAPPVDPRDVSRSEGRVEFLLRREDNSPVLPVTAERKKTEITSSKTGDTSVKSTPTELVTSLKDILSALQDQFVRTESLAEKLTENMKLEGTGTSESGVAVSGAPVLTAWEKPIAAELVENLRSARKDPSCGQRSPRLFGYLRSEGSKKSADGKVVPSDVLSDEGGSSLGEIIVSDRRRRGSEKSESSSISECSFVKADSLRRSSRGASARRETSGISAAVKFEVSNEAVLYSEGEIPSDDLSCVERFRSSSSSSLGEVGH